MQLLELEHELRQRGGGNERATVYGSKMHNVAKKLELDDNNVASCEVAIGFMAPTFCSQTSELIFQLIISIMVSMICLTKTDLISKLSQTKRKKR